MRRLTIVALVLGLIGVRAFAQGTGQPTGAVQGQVFIKDADGGRSVVPATKITLDGPTQLEAESDNEGNFALSTVPAGSYTITANTPGMAAMQGVVVTAGAVSQVQLEMKLEAVAESTTVIASASSVDTKSEPSGTNTIGESAIRNMPNIDEQSYACVEAGEWLDSRAGRVRRGRSHFCIRSDWFFATARPVTRADSTCARSAVGADRHPLVCLEFSCSRWCRNGLNWRDWNHPGGDCRVQAVIAIPEMFALVRKERAAELLLRPIAGVPLIIRTVLTAARAGANDILLTCPAALSEQIMQQLVGSTAQFGIHISVVQLADFNPFASSGWRALKPHLQQKFLWVPWNWVTTKQLLAHLPVAQFHSVNWAEPACTTFYEVTRDDFSSALLHPEGVAVTSPESATSAERFLVARSGKVLDGIHTSLNRRLCRPFVRMLSHTAVPPNAVTFGGIVVSLVSAVAFAHGAYWWSVLGAVLFYVAGLFDEMDGMLARLKFAESPRGTYLEGFADGLSYLLLFTGVTVGMYRHYGRAAIFMGVALLIGASLALITTTLQRKRATTPDRPNEYLGNFYRLLEKDSGNWISRVVRQVQGFQRRGILIHYIVLFTILGLLPLIFLLATVGAHLTWILTLYFNRRFFTRSQTDVKPTVSKFKEAL